MNSLSAFHPAPRFGMIHILTPRVNGAFQLKCRQDADTLPPGPTNPLASALNMLYGLIAPDPGTKLSYHRCPNGVGVLLTDYQTSDHADFPAFKKTQHPELDEEQMLSSFLARRLRTGQLPNWIKAEGEPAGEAPL